jgi:nickel/cobalt exporter
MGTTMCTTDHANHDHAHHGHGDHHAHAHGRSHHGSAAFTHSHGGGEHAHLPPGADGSPIRWHSLLALGVSGGLLPCPSALVILLSAIALHRVAYGLLLVVAFSFGLAATLTGIGLAFIHAGRWIKSPTGPRIQQIMRVLPAASALVIMVVGAGICGEALVQAGRAFPALLAGMSSASGIGLTAIELNAALVSLLAVLALGVMLALKRG